MTEKKIKQNRGYLIGALVGIVFFNYFFMLFRAGNYEGMGLSLLLIVVGVVILLWFRTKEGKRFETPQMNFDPSLYKEVSRFMIVPTYDASMEYTYYTLQGDKLAHSFVKPLTKSQDATRFLFSLASLSFILPVRTNVTLGTDRYIVDKHGGFKTKFSVYNEEGRLCYTFRKTKDYKHGVVTNRNGDVLAVLQDSLGSMQVHITDLDKKQLFRIRIGGIPTEAMALFGDVDGDIVDCYELVSDSLYTLPLLLSMMFRSQRM
ncbi:hypothetical protein [Bacillus alkalicellulosilyticus]|uniref:hypothetical protein n=1 Tax=Alkalihalobacterium alkalicellulosilyticum TaxID=1912214 RepID=UPI000997DBBF|nr:hypothetical protein [Bacillus alkalicellulosilyticus]